MGGSPSTLEYSLNCESLWNTALDSAGSVLASISQSVSCADFRAVCVTYIPDSVGERNQRAALDHCQCVVHARAVLESSNWLAWFRSLLSRAYTSMWLALAVF